MRPTANVLATEDTELHKGTPQRNRDVEKNSERHYLQLFSSVGFPSCNFASFVVNALMSFCSNT